VGSGDFWFWSSEEGPEVFMVYWSCELRRLREKVVSTGGFMAEVKAQCNGKGIGEVWRRLTRT
jgi:hypothetical protein